MIHRFLGSVAILAITFCTTAKAEVIFVVGNGDGLTTPIEVTAGTEARIPVFAFSTVPGINLNSYTLAIDFIGDGFQPISSDFTNLDFDPGDFNTDGDVLFQTPAGLGIDIFPQTNFDFVASDGQDGVLLPVTQATALNLFDLVFDVDAATNPGVFAVDAILTTEVIGAQSGVTTSPSGQTLGGFNGSFEVVAIPEPGSVACLIGGLMVSGLRRRRRLV